MESVKRILERAKRIADELVPFITMILPITWVFCYDDVMEYVIPDDLVRLIGDVFICCLAFLFLLAFGLWMGGLTIVPDQSNKPPAGKWTMLGIEILVILFVAGKISKY